MTEILECPLCGIKVRKGQRVVYCEGPCSTWYHKKCMGMLDIHFNELANDSTTSWECPTCESFEEKPEEQNLLNQDTSNNKLALLIDSLRDRESNDDKELEESSENSIIMAAEIGSALLERVTQLEKDNSILDQQLTNASALNEQLGIEIISFQEKESRLVETINDLSKQLDKEKALRENLKRTFEGHDEKQESIIADHLILIHSLKKTIENLTNIRKPDYIENSEFSRHDAIEKPKDCDPTVRTNDEIKGLTSKFRAMEVRLTALETSALKDKANILTLTENFAAFSIDKQPITQDLNSHEIPNMSYQDQCETTHAPINVKGDSNTKLSLTIHSETYFCSKDLIDHSDKKRQVPKPPCSAINLKRSNINLKDLLDEHIKSHVANENKEKTETKSVQSANTEPGNKASVQSIRSSQLPNASCSYKKNNAFLGLPRMKMSQGRHKYGGRVFTNSLLKRSEYSTRTSTGSQIRLNA